MDFLTGLARDALEPDKEGANKTGGSELNRDSHSGHKSSSAREDIDDDKAIASASEHYGDTAGSDLFASALSFLGSSSSNTKAPLDEEQVVKSHQNIYEGKEKPVEAKAIGSAAALQILKTFVSGKGPSSDDSSEGGNFQTKLIGLAMAEAAKMFDAKGGAIEGSKQDAVNGAAETVIKLLIQSKFGGPTIGGKDSGGLGSLLSLASQFAK